MPRMVALEKDSSSLEELRGLPKPKRAKVVSVTTGTDYHGASLEARVTSWLLCHRTADSGCLPASLSAQTKADYCNTSLLSLTKLRAVFVANHLRMTITTSPREAVSVYKDSLVLVDNDDSAGKEFLVLMFGMHQKQLEMEEFYTDVAKPLHCLHIFCQLVREACSEALEASEELSQVLRETNERIVSSHATSLVDLHNNQNNKAAAACSCSEETVKRICQLSVAADPRLRLEQLQHEYERIEIHNSTLSNALLSLFVQLNSITIKDMYYKRSHLAPQYERITVYVYDQALDERKPPHFTFLPSLHTALHDGPEVIAKHMVSTFWSHLLRRGGYFATQPIRETMEPDLEKYFLSGIANNPIIPLQLNSHFTPSLPLCFYLHGRAGAGKSSLVRHFSPAAAAAVNRHADPEILVQFVKQNLNKPLATLRLELELRPNNNDMSVMSIIQSRRRTMRQSKNGLVVVGLEEMAPPPCSGTLGIVNDPNQLATAQLISQRFAGRKGEYSSDETSRQQQAHRNSETRGISGDPTIGILFTSNYALEEASLLALQKLEMFQNLRSVRVNAVAGDDRVEFANQYLHQCVKDQCGSSSTTVVSVAHLDIPMGDGDTRPLVRHLRMLAFYVGAALREDDDGTLVAHDKIEIVQQGGRCAITTAPGKDAIELKVGTMENLFPLTPQVVDPRLREISDQLQSLQIDFDVNELSVILDFWLARTLAPAVIVSNDADKIQAIIAIAARLKDVHSIPSIDASLCKMMKSLYDPRNTPNLRGEILKFGKGATVAVELKCETIDAQLCIREIIEDTPSMTAFSSEKSALYKDGLLFGVYVNGEITPEVRSRASLIL